ncbi:MAG: nucleotidyl transferase AbiEii/AbiGii toxin family protein [Gammaproteobacteria bacterium]|nr:nucleotidyl transferase AbiEii/AbiGii toxin family protein [Gammaproteobacteria bacterium]
MTSKQIRNYPASVHRRLLDLARERGEEFNRILQRYVAERFLYRLTISPFVDEFTLKGAALYRVWSANELRPTKDVDFLGSGREVRQGLREIVQAICGASCPEDGIVFDPTAVHIRDAQHDQEYSSLRARVLGNLGQARLTLQMDVGFGDAITPGREERDYPTMLDLPAPRLWTYPRETVVAEKFEAMVSLGTRNTRVKDLWDVACMARLFPFDGETLRAAVEETFRRRQTSLGAGRPMALLPSYYEDVDRDHRWQVLRRQMAAEIDGPVRLVDTGDEIRRFLGPVSDSVIAGRSHLQVWLAGGPWQSAEFAPRPAKAQ